MAVQLVCLVFILLKTSFEGPNWRLICGGGRREDGGGRGRGPANERRWHGKTKTKANLRWVAEWACVKIYLWVGLDYVGHCQRCVVVTVRTTFPSPTLASSRSIKRRHPSRSRGSHVPPLNCVCAHYRPPRKLVNTLLPNSSRLVMRDK